MMKFESANLKVNRARELISEVVSLIDKAPPFTYFLETDTKSRTRSTLSKTNQDSLNFIVIRCGEVLHNLRSALDNAYWEAVSPVVESKKHVAIQFPFTKNASGLSSGIKSRLAHLVSENFYKAIESMKPHGGEDGNKLLNFLHETNINDKHKFPTPIGDFTHISSSIICKEVPDFPKGMENCSFGSNGRDVCWNYRLISLDDIGKSVTNSKHVFHKALKAPVGMRFSSETPFHNMNPIVILNDIADEVDKMLKVMASALELESSPIAKPTHGTVLSFDRNRKKLL